MESLAGLHRNARAVGSQYDLSAATWQEVNAAQNAVTAALCQPITRAAYEAQCSEIAVVALSDAEIRRAGYTIRHFDMPTEPIEWVRFGLARQRLNALDAEARAARPLAPAVVMARCSACGVDVVAGTLMNASRHAGVCSDCYDGYSD